jgi:hypothetical protein
MLHTTFLCDTPFVRKSRRINLSLCQAGVTVNWYIQAYISCIIFGLLLPDLVRNNSVLPERKLDTLAAENNAVQLMTITCIF